MFGHRNTSLVALRCDLHCFFLIHMLLFCQAIDVDRAAALHNPVSEERRIVFSDTEPSSTALEKYPKRSSLPDSPTLQNQPTYCIMSRWEEEGIEQQSTQSSASYITLTRPTIIRYFQFFSSMRSVPSIMSRSHASSTQCSDYTCPPLLSAGQTPSYQTDKLG